MPSDSRTLSSIHNPINRNDFRDVAGWIGEARTAELFLRHGWDVNQPVLKTVPYDLHVRKGDRSEYIQCKYRSMYRGCVQVKNQRSKVDHTKRFKNDFDLIRYFSIYSRNNDNVYIVPTSLISESFSLRIEKSKNNQQLNTHDAELYLEPEWVTQ